ncbi:hypothetical protein [Sedimentitalea todarodis]|uniref:Uncharacterized protein n=1 Tax=Sedimentitalea todarodis TaxID=1631240 RepID=A0ABU3VDS1_9RHOB|nr:hypothetical protein [Sedimentitalea todarodis]MDU9004243.1 hypothetical protein [Sedimentitalea todarodis]
MLGLLRLVLILFVVQTIAYIGLSFYSRSLRRRKLELRWSEKALPVDQETFVRRGLTRYDNSLRRKLILGVYIVPWIAISVLIYVVNFM